MAAPHWSPRFSFMNSEKIHSSDDISSVATLANRKTSGALARFVVHPRDHKRTSLDKVSLEVSVKSTITEHNEAQQLRRMSRAVQAQCGFVGRRGTVEIYVPPFDKELLDRIANLPNVESIQRPLPFHLPNNMQTNRRRSSFGL